MITMPQLGTDTCQSCGIFFARKEEAMPTIPRTGRPKTLTLEYEAVEILEQLAQGYRAQGWLISTLLRQEEARRIEARRLREARATGAEDVLTAR
jgi:hypothetical protein